MRRATPVPPQDTSCATIRQNYESQQAFTAFKEATGPEDIKTLVDSFKNVTGNQYSTLMNSDNPLDNNQRIQLLDNLMLAENILNVHLKCLNKDIIQRNDYVSKIYTLQQEVESVRKEASEKKETVKEAEERASQLENPYTKTTWWETWFPLGRPIQKENVPVLLSVSIGMLVISLGIFLRFAGLELRFESIQPSANSFLKNIRASKYP
jgi:hypothetical protein